jgi:hypothetical protein
MNPPKNAICIVAVQLAVDPVPDFIGVDVAAQPYEAAP